MSETLRTKSQLPRKRGKFPGGFCKDGNLKHGAYRTKIDGRTKDAREIQTVVANWISDLGGADNLSSMELSIIGDLSIIAWRARRLGRVIVQSNGDCPESITRDFLRFHSALVDGLSKIGLKRQAKEVESLQEYLKRKELQSSSQQEPQQ